MLQHALFLYAGTCVDLVLVPSQFLLQVCSFLANLSGVQYLHLRSFRIFEVVMNGIEKLLIFLDRSQILLRKLLP